MAPVEIRLRDCIVMDACPACASYDVRPHDYAPSLLPSMENCPGGVAVLEDELVRRRRLMVCNDCGLWFLSVIPNADRVQALNNTPDYSVRLRPGVSRRSFQRGWRTLRERFPDHGSILDVGASGGDFLRGCQGWHRAAMEPSTSSHAALSFCDVVYDGVLDNEERLPPAHFDAVSLFDVAEHLSSPFVAFSALARAIKPKGVVLIETGNTDSRAARAGALWYYVRYLAHFVFFNRRSLSSILQRTGFRLLEFRCVHHEEPTWRTWASVSARGVAYALLARFGRRPAPWTALASALGKSGAAPFLPFPDHFYAVAQRV